MAVNMKQVSRADKRTIAQQVSAKLKARAQKGPAELALDAYIPELDENADALNEHVEGHVAAQEQGRLPQKPAYARQASEAMAPVPLVSP